MLKDRAPQVQKILADADLDALVFLNLTNIRYLCGFTGTDGALVVTRTGSSFLTDSRYTAQASQQVRADSVVEYRVKNDSIIECLAAQEAVRVGFEAQTTPYATVRQLQEKGGDEVEWVALENELQALRIRKGPEEIAALARAAQFNAKAFEEILPLIRPGAIERDIALALEFALKRLGGEDKAFDFIVASGYRGALPHGVASDKKIEAGDLVTIDFGTRYEGYYSDETVTLALGEVSAKQRQIFDVVLEAHDRAMELVRPGVALKDIDATARQYIADKGFGDYFGHGLGHGVGLEIHEYPPLSRAFTSLTSVVFGSRIPSR